MHGTVMPDRNPGMAGLINIFIMRQHQLYFAVLYKSVDANFLPLDKLFHQHILGICRSQGILVIVSAASKASSKDAILTNGAVVTCPRTKASFIFALSVKIRAASSEIPGRFNVWQV